MREKYELQYAGEKTRVRIWQDAALVALESLMATNPPTREEIEKSPAGLEEYARMISRAAYTVADEMHKQHGPSVSSRLQQEGQVVAVASGGTYQPDVD